MSKPLPLSVAVVTLNEAANLRRCLGSVGELAEEIVVVDSGSDDGTQDVAREFGARVFQQVWLGFRDQKNVALSHCTRPWVLNLDADEELSPELRASIRRFFEGDHERSAGAIFSRKVLFMERWITHGDWYPDRKLRLFRRDRARWAGTAGHDRVEVDGPATVLDGDLLHYSYPDIRSYISKINSFSDSHLDEAVAAGRRWSLAENLARPIWRFFRAYGMRRGFLDGFPGLWIAVATAFSAFVRHSRLYEHSLSDPERERRR
jgi:glycosyltransferase involved in cell wall biosynthesis